MDDRRFDELSRRVGALALPRLPRRGLMGLLGGATLAGALGLVLDPQPAEAAKCKKEGKKCDKKKCKKKDKKCCCKDLKCKNGRCESKGGRCPTNLSFDLEWDGGSQAGGDFDTPWGIAIDLDSGDVYVTDTENERVQVFNQNGNFLDEWGSLGNGQEQFQTPLGIGFNENSGGNDRVYVADPDQSNDTRKFRRFSPDGDFLADLAPANLDNPAGVTVDSDGNIWVVNASTPGRVFRFDENGDLDDDFTPGGQGSLTAPEGIAVFEDNDENATFVFVADTGANRIVKFELVSGDLQFVKAEDDAGNENLNRPTGLAVDECGNLWAADRISDEIQLYDKNLNHEDSFGTNGTDPGEFMRPTGVALSPNGNSLYVVDSENDRVQKFDLS